MPIPNNQAFSLRSISVITETSLLTLSIYLAELAVFWTTEFRSYTETSQFTQAKPQ